MTYRVRRKFTGSTFRVHGQLCKIFLEPTYEYCPGFWHWNVGFAVGKSRRQLNDWYWNRKNKRWRSLYKRMMGKAGISTLYRATEELLKLRWSLAPGDCLSFQSTSKYPDKQVDALKRWQRRCPDCVIDEYNREFIWYRPPYPNDAVYQVFDVIPITPEDHRTDNLGDRYFNCFSLRLKGTNIRLSTAEMRSLLDQVQSTSSEQ